MTELARRGVAYIVLPHLLWRAVATNAPALPFLPDWLYRVVFPQPKVGLTELGRAAATAMVREGVLIDLSHMSTLAVADTFELLDRLDPDRPVPVLASHAGYRFGGQEYTLDEQTVELIAGRDGVIGLIFAQHQLNDGLRRTRAKTLRGFVRGDLLRTSTGSPRSPARTATPRSARTSTGSSSRPWGSSSR